MYLIGVDEVGTGALAGPAYVCAVRTDPAWLGPEELRDSKQLSAKKRKQVSDALNDMGLEFRLVEVERADIDSHGIRAAVDCAMLKAVEAIVQHDDYIIVDGSYLPPQLYKYRVEAFPKADTIYPTVMAASVIAKVFRDSVMDSLHHKYPEYGFSKHKGYGTKDHLKALWLHGPCEIHRKSFKPVAEAMQ